MTRDRIGLGRRGEQLAAGYLERMGLQILARNVRTPVGEIDLLACDGPVWVFVEVRARRGTAFGTPEDSITARKQARMVAAAEHYLSAHDLENVDWRIDTVAVEFSASGELRRIEVLENAVEI